MVLLFCSVRRALDGILRSLDHSVGRQLTSTNPQAGKSVEEILRSVNIIFCREENLFTCLQCCKTQARLVEDMCGSHSSHSAREHEP